MQITSWNVNGLRAIVKKDFNKIIKKLNPDILCLQETKAQEPEVFKALKELAETYKIYVNSAQKKGYSGTAVLTKTKPLKATYGIGIPKHDNEGRVITLEYNAFFLVNVYTPNAGQELKRLDYKAQWDKDFQDYVMALDKIRPVIIAGDLNVAHQEIDLKNPKSNYNKTAGYTDVEIQGFSKLLKAGFIDTFRYLYPDRVAYTYWSYRFNARARNAGWRIDYFLVSKRFIDHVEDVIIHDDIYGSDHCPISLLLKD